MRYTCPSLWAALLLLGMGCQDSSVRGTSPTLGLEQIEPAYPKDLDEFVWRDISIQHGMAKGALLDHIRTVGPYTHQKGFGIRLTSSEESNPLILSYGNASGAAPGGGVLEIFLEDDAVSRIAFVCPYR